MLQTRVIPVLLIKDKGLVKTKKFKDGRYIGDPVNAVNIFNEKEVDEIIILDIEATIQNRSPDFSFINEIASQAFMPLSYGGGIKCIEDVQKLIRIGVEKVIINSEAYTNELLLKSIIDQYGSQSLIVSIDIKKNIFGKYEVLIKSGTKKIKSTLYEVITYFEKLGVGEIFLNSIDHDGMMAGFDVELIKMVSDRLSIPLIACGGAGSLSDLKMAKDAGATAVAAGSLFVYHGKHKAVLLTYPSYEALNQTLN